MTELIFITSNSAKLSHAKHLCKDYAVRISKQKNYGIGYVEPRLENRDELIKKSVEDAIIRFRKNVQNHENKFFFIEDTSVVIKALSEDKEYPGVDIKYWMQENTFKDVDKLLREKGNNRNAVVRSDLILVLSSTLAKRLGVQYKIFTSQVDGSITEQEHKVSTQPLYPWLSQKTFNKWFVPNGCGMPMSLLDIEEADKHDFRVGAFKKMLQFLHENQIIKTIDEDNQLRVEQLNLFKQVGNFIVCGPSCAGKTTLADYLVNNYNYYHVEASDFMYLSYYERHGTNSDVLIGDFAEDALKNNPAVVADQIIEHIKKNKSIPIVITGFRDPREIESFLSNYKGDFGINIVYVDTDQGIRYIRFIKRGRDPLDENVTLDDFKKKDEQQNNMGLPLIKTQLSSTIITNNETFEDYYSCFEKQFANQLMSSKEYIVRATPKLFMKGRLQTAIVLTLLDQSNLKKYYTTTEIAHLINANSKYSSNPKSKNNVSRYFNQNFHPYFEVSKNDGYTSYRLSQTGIAYAKFLKNNVLNK